MAISIKYKDITFGVGDKIKITQKIKEGGKERAQAFEGIVISIKGRDENKSFTVRKMGATKIGIEKIYPLILPSIEKIEVVKKGGSGVKKAKLYYLRNKTKKEIEKIYIRTKNKTS